MTDRPESSQSQLSSRMPSSSQPTSTAAATVVAPTVTVNTNATTATAKPAVDPLFSHWKITKKSPVQFTIVDEQSIRNMYHKQQNAQQQQPSESSSSSSSASSAALPPLYQKVSPTTTTKTSTTTTSSQAHHHHHLRQHHEARVEGSTSSSFDSEVVVPSSTTTGINHANSRLKNFENQTFTFHINDHMNNNNKKKETVVVANTTATAATAPTTAATNTTTTMHRAPTSTPTVVQHVPYSLVKPPTRYHFDHDYSSSTSTSTFTSNSVQQQPNHIIHNFCFPPAAPNQTGNEKTAAMKRIASYDSYHHHTQQSRLTHNHYHHHQHAGDHHQNQYHHHHHHQHHHHHSANGANGKVVLNSTVPSSGSIQQCLTTVDHEQQHSSSSSSSLSLSYPTTVDSSHLVGNSTTTTMHNLGRKRSIHEVHHDDLEALRAKAHLIEHETLSGDGHSNSSHGDDDDDDDDDGDDVGEPYENSSNDEKHHSSSEPHHEWYYSSFAHNRAYMDELTGEQRRYVSGGYGRSKSVPNSSNYDTQYEQYRHQNPHYHYHRRSSGSNSSGGSSGSGQEQRTTTSRNSNSGQESSFRSVTTTSDGHSTLSSATDAYGLNTVHTHAPPRLSITSSGSLSSFASSSSSGSSSTLSSLSHDNRYGYKSMSGVRRNSSVLEQLQAQAPRSISTPSTTTTATNNIVPSSTDQHLSPKEHLAEHGTTHQPQHEQRITHVERLPGISELDSRLFARRRSSIEELSYSFSTACKTNHHSYHHHIGDHRGSGSSSDGSREGDTLSNEMMLLEEHQRRLRRRISYTEDMMVSNVDLNRESHCHPPVIAASTDSNLNPFSAPATDPSSLVPIVDTLQSYCFPVKACPSMSHHHMPNDNELDDILPPLRSGIQ